MPSERRQRGVWERTVWERLMVLFTVFVLLMVACGDGDDEEEGDESTTVTSTATDMSTTTTSTPTTTAETTTTRKAPTEQNVLVYFGTGDPDACEAVAPHERTVPATAEPIRAAFDELVGGPNAAEIADGAFSFFSNQTEGTVRSATVRGGQLVADFDDFRAVLTPAGANSSCGSAALLSELNSTAFQFGAVDSIRYELEGSCPDFGEWLQRDCIEITRAEWDEVVAGLLPGEPFEGILPPAAILGAIGVAVDDLLNVRALPGADQAILDSLDPLTTGLVHTGRARRLGPPTAVWYEVEVNGLVGWVHSRFVAPLSGVFDITSEVVDVVGEIPTGDTVGEIGEIVLEARSRFADPKPTGIVVDGPSAGDLHEITYDLIGFGDDSVLGERLHLFIAEEGGTFGLKSVEVTYLCARGAGGGTGLCP
ncbi:MAG: GerMN domain-containing protein [Actinomycetia bacterium]|nr:GerMN domain-containing protein [Actinomycetes bacterium]